MAFKKIMAENATSAQELKARMETAQQAFAQFPEKFPPPIREYILAGQVVWGMDTYQAYLAAGLFSYKVEADPEKWPPHVDPLQVIWAQAKCPDKSSIVLNFRNETQYPAEGMSPFCVRFESGRATVIQKLGVATAVRASQ